MSFSDLITPPEADFITSEFCIKLPPRMPRIGNKHIHRLVAMKSKECHKVALIGLRRMLTDCCSATMWQSVLRLFLIGQVWPFDGLIFHNFFSMRVCLGYFYSSIFVFPSIPTSFDLAIAKITVQSLACRQ